MRNWNILFVSFIFVCLLPLSAQDFVTLNWQKSSIKHPVNFDDAHFINESILPRYIQNLDLGLNYTNSLYDVKLEYPEFAPLAKNELELVIQSKEIIGDLPNIQKRVIVSAKRGMLEVSFLPIVYRNGKYQRIKSFKLSLVKSINRQKSITTKLHSFASNSVLAIGKWVKIRVDEDGIYKITNAELLKMGFRNPAKVRLHGYGGYLLNESFRSPKYDDLPEIPLWRENNYVLFYARGTVRWDANPTSRFLHVNNCYSDYSYYFLAEDESLPMAFPVEQSLSSVSSTQITAFDDHALYEKDSFGWAASGRELYDSYDYIAGNKRDYSFIFPGITSENAYCTIGFSAKSARTSNVALQINGNNSGALSISAMPSGDYSCKAMTAESTMLWQGDKPEKNTLTLTHTRDDGSSGRLNYLRVNYRRNLSLYNSYTAFRNLESVNKKTTYTISGANNTTKVWEVTNPSSYKQINGELVGDKYSFTTENPYLKELVAVDVNGSFKSVQVVGTIANQNLHGLSQCDMVIVVPSNGLFVQQAERLAEAHRAKDKMIVHVVTANQIYNEFSSGTPDATAYRWFMKMFYDRATSQTDIPKYLLLFGDCSWDNRMKSAAWQGYSPDDFLLSYQSVNSTWETYSYVTDDYMGLLDDQDGSDLRYDGLDIGVGRFPVRTVEQATQMVDKTIGYMENKELGAWKNTICYVADDGDNHLHIDQADKLAMSTEKSNPEFMISRIFADAYKWETTSTGHFYRQANKQLLDLFNQGMLMVNYTGHGGVTGWSGEGILSTADILAMRSTKLPLWVTATCDFTRYDDVASSAGELAFLNDKGGAIALFTTSRLVYSQENSNLNKAFCKYVFAKENGKRLRLGDVMRKSKCDISLSGDANKLKFSLIGDPALTLAYPDYKIVVDEFNGRSATSANLSIKAGEKVLVKGRLTDLDGNLLTDYNGKVYPTVLDTKEKVTTLNNDGTGIIQNPNNPNDRIPGGYTFYRNEKKLFSGTGTVESGLFSFSFPVPKDINYSNESGILNLYAADSTTGREAQGLFNNFLIGGTASDMGATDGVGPKINLYLNTPNFVSGDKTNQNPYLVVELEDADGINTVGNGVGHDIIAMVDESPNNLYVLNSYYESEFNDYTKGVVRYSLPILTEGKHSLFFRAWDVQNNSSSQRIDFEVVRGAKPQLIQLMCTPNPAKSNTTFVIAHDRPQSNLDITISVCDFAGRVLWTKKESGISGNNNYTVNWDLTSNAGQRIAAGVYLFRVAISSEGSKESTQTGKIVILAQ